MDERKGWLTRGCGEVEKRIIGSVPASAETETRVLIVMHRGFPVENERYWGVGVRMGGYEEEKDGILRLRVGSVFVND